MKALLITFIVIYSISTISSLIAIRLNRQNRKLEEKLYKQTYDNVMLALRILKDEIRELNNNYKSKI